MTECLFGVIEGQLTGNSPVVGQREVQDTSLLESAVLTDHQPSQGVTVLVGGLLDHLLQSVVREKGPKAGDISVVWSVIVEVEIFCDDKVTRSCGVLVQNYLRTQS